ncbi:hypothetical protein C8R43DRAFT_491772, partial [Mycena crocata]
MQQEIRSVRSEPAIVALLRSGRLPSPEEAPTIRDIIQGAKANISSDKDLLWDLQEQIYELEHRAGILKENQRVCESLFSPIRKLPPEIIQLVLELSVDANHFKSSPKASDLVAAPLASVCAQWRTIALSTPRIWARFIVDNAANTKAFQSIERHLQRAGDAKLDFDLRAPKSVVVGHEILELFCSRASRWRTAAFRFASLTPKASEIVSSLPENLPALRTLHIRLPPGSSYSAINIKFFKTCPALRVLSLLDYTPQAEHTIPWAQLTSIHYMPSDTRHMLTVLDLCPNLVSFSVSLPATPSMPAAPTTDPRLFPSLHTLRIDSRTRSGARHLSGVLAVCAALTLPALRSLAFVTDTRRRYRGPEDFGRHEAGQWPHAAVTAFLTRSAAPLKSLSLEGVPLDTTELLALLRLAPHATRVSLRECPTANPETLRDNRLWKVSDDIGANHFVTDALLDALTVAVRDPAPLPAPAP